MEFLTKNSNVRFLKQLQVFLKKISGADGIDCVVFWVLIFSGMILRVILAVSTIDVVHPDEHFQTLEPASKVVYGFGYLHWEWQAGIRSWFVPGLYMPVMWIYKILGVRGGPVVIYACRSMMAVFSSFMLFGFQKLLLDRNLRALPHYLGLGLVALSPIMLISGAATLSDTWGMILLWLVMPVFLNRINENRSWFVPGVLLGLGFLIRIQMATIGVGFFLYVILFCKPKKIYLKKLAHFSLGYLIPVIAQGMLDWMTWGAPFHSAVQNVVINFFQDAASSYGISPWYDYFFKINGALGNNLTVLLIIIYLIGIIFGKGKNNSKELRDQPLLFLVFFYFAVHSVIRHKELRFIFPICPAIFYFAAVSVQRVYDRLYEDSLEFFKSKNLKKIGLLTVLLTIPFYVIDSPSFLLKSSLYADSNMSELMLRIYDEHLLQEHDCVVLIDHYFVWSHGYLLQGQSADFRQESSANITDQSLKECRYAVTTAGSNEPFLKKSQSRWQWVLTNQWSYSLYRRL